MHSSKKVSAFLPFLTVHLLFLAVACNLYANPEGENVVAGSAAFDRSTPNTLTVNTASDKAIINYNSFSIASNETTRFNQPSASSAVLNRVVGVDPSSIYGTLSSNGKLFLVNPNGIVFGAGSRVNAPAIVASTLDIANEDFLKGNYVFFKNGNKNAYIINQGRIAAQPGGYIALLSQAIDNQGVIIADLGTIALAAGEKMTLALDALGQISVVVDEAVQSEVLGPDGQRIDSAIKNSGSIQANGGKIILTAKVLNNVFDYAVNNSGVIKAGSVEEHDGVVELTAEGAPVINTGSIIANTVTIKVKGADFINKGSVIAETNPVQGEAPQGGDRPAQQEAPALDADPGSIVAHNGDLLIKAENIIQDGRVSADNQATLNATQSIKTDPIALPDPAIVIQANQVNLISKQFGSIEAPLNIDASLTYIYRTEGSIDILDSLGIGTSILLRGPPENGFGAIVYNRNTNLTLDAQSGSISEAQGAILPANNLSLIANQNIDIYGTLIARSVILDSLNGDTILYSGSVIDASGVVGGLVEILGNRVGLFGARINASGINGGGTVLIGGDHHGSGTLHRALRTYIDSDSVINADAIYIGNGGKVIVWSDEVTRFFGSVTARGGAQGGNGGFAEISGKQNLEARIGNVDLGAPKGNSGILLLDPANIVITGGSTDGSDTGTSVSLLDMATDGTVVFGDTPSSFTVYESEIEETNANIVLQAANSITVSGTFNQNGNGEGTGAIVRLQTDRSLTMDTRNASGEGSGGINLTGVTVEFQTQGTGSITIRAGITGTGAGGDAGSAPVTVGTLSTLGTGSITLQAEGALTVSGALTTGDVTANPATTGNITLTAGGAVNINAALKTGNATSSTDDATTGTINITATGITSNASGTITTGVATGGNNTGDTAVSGAITLDANTGTVSLGAALLTGNANTSTNDGDNATSGNITITDAGSVTLNAASTTGSALTGSNGSNDATSGTISVTGTSITSNASGLITTGIATSGGSSNDDAISGSVTLSGSGGVTLAAAVATGATNTFTNTANLATSGNINVTSTAGAFSSTSTLTTGLAQADGTRNNNIATSGNITLNASGAIQLSAANALTTGNANFGGTTGGTGLTAKVGDITVTSADKVSSNGINGAVDVSFGTATGASTNTSGTLAITTDGGVGDAGGISVTSGEALRVGALITSGTSQTVSIATTGGANLTVTDVSESLNGDAVSFSTATGTLTIADINFNVGSGSLTLTTDGTLTISGGPSSIKGTGGTVTIQPASVGTSIGIAGAAGTLQVTTTHIAALQDGFAGITIGRADGTGLATISSVTFNDPVTIQMPGVSGDITLSGALTTSATNSAITLIAGTGDGGTFTRTAGAGNTIASGSGAITITADLIVLNNNADTITGSGAITLRPATVARPIVIGAAGAATDFALDTNEIAALTNGFSSITIGRSSDGTGSVTVSGAVSFNDNVTLVGGSIAGNATITSTGNTVALTARVTDITDGNGATNNISAGTATLTAATGIGSADALETIVSTLSFANTTNAVQITNTLAGGVTVSGTNAGTGAVNITETSGNLTVGASNIVTNGGAVNLTASTLNKIVTTTGGINTTNGGVAAGAAVTLTADKMALSGSINAGSSLVTLKPQANGQIINIGAADVDGTLGLTATEIKTITNTGGITIGSSTNTGGITVSAASDLTGITGGTLTLQSNSGTINVNALLTSPIDATLTTASGNIAFGAAGAITATGKTVTLTATAGNIEGNGATLTNVTASTLNASASSGIGSANALETNVNYISAQNTISGNIKISDTGSLTVDDLSGSGGFNGISNTATGGSVDIIASTNLTVNAPIGSEGDISLTATSGYIVQNADITITQTAILPTPGIISSSHPTDTWQSGVSNDPTVNVSWGLTDPDPSNTLYSFTANAGGVYTQSGSATDITTNGGDVTITAGGNVTLTLINAGAGDVSITSTSGSIIDGDNGFAPADYDIKGRTITLSPATSVDYGQGGTVASAVDIGYPVSGFSYIWSHGTSDPNSSSDPYSTSFSGGAWTFSTTSSTLADATNWYFNVASVDGLGGQSTTASRGAFYIDTTAPSFDTLTRTSGETSWGWNNSDVTASYTASDATSTIDTVASDATSYTYTNAVEGDGANLAHSFTIQDKAGNTTTLQVTDHVVDYASTVEDADADLTINKVNIDRVAPTISTTRTPPPHSNGWNDVAVTVDYTVGDGLSGIDDSNPLTDYSSDTVSTDTVETGLSGTVYDKAGNSATAEETIKIKLHESGTFTWDGSTDTSWDEWENWNTHVAPSNIDKVVVAGGVGILNNPILVANTGAKELTINTDGSLNVAGHKLTITDSFSNSGEVTTSSGNIEIIAGDITAGKITNPNPGGAITLTADTISLGANITGSGTVTLQPNDAAGSIGIGDAAAGDFNLDATEIGYLQNGFNHIYIGRPDGNGAVTVNAITFNDPVTIRSPNSGGSITINGQITGTDNASITLDGSGATTTLNADIITDRMAIDILDSVEIGAALVTLDTTNAGGAGSGVGADISISGTTDSTGGTNSLTLNAGTGGNITLTGDVGAGSPLNALNTIQANDVTFSGKVNATNIAQTDSQGTTWFRGDVTMTGAVGGYGIDLRSKTNINLGGGGPAITINAGDNPIRTRSDSFTINVIGITASSVTIAPYTAGTAVGVEDNTIAFNIPDSILDLISGAVIIGDAFTGPITIANTLNSGTPNVNLTQNKDLTFISGSTIDVMGVGAGPAITTTDNGGVTITNAGTLTIDAAGDMNLDGAFTQNGAGTVSTAGDITITNDTISFAAPVTLTGNVALTGSTVTFDSTLDGAQTLDIVGNAVFNSIVGGIPLTSIGVSGTTGINTSAVSTSGTQEYHGAVTLGADATLTGGSTITFGSTVDGAHNLTLNATGETDFNDDVGSTEDPIGDGSGAALTVNSSGVTDFKGKLTTASGITQINGAGRVIFRKDVSVGAGSTPSTFYANVRLSGMAFTSNNAVTFGNSASDNLDLTVNAVTIRTLGAGSTLIVNAQTNGSQDLTLDTSGAATFNAQVGNNLLIGIIGDGSGAAITINSLGTTAFTRTVTTASGIVQGVGAGAITFQRDVTVNAGGDTANTFNGNVILDGLTFTSAGDITFGDSTTDQLTLSASAVTINTSSSGVNVTFNSKIDGNQDLTVNSGAGTTSFNGAVGSLTVDGLGSGVGTSLQIDSAHDVNFNADVTTKGDILQVTGTGTTTIDNSLIDCSGNIDITNGAISFLDNGRMIANSGTGSVTLTAQVGAITSGTADTDITADTLSATAATDIGSSDNPLATSINNLYAYAGGSINLYDIGSLTLEDVEAGSLATVNITSVDDLYVNYVQDGYDDGDEFIGGTVNLTSNTGSIIGLSTEDVNIRTADLTLNANSGSIYGDDGNLVTDVDNLWAYAGSDIDIYDTGSLTLQDVEGGLAGINDTVNITSADTLYVDYVQDGYDDGDEFIGGTVNLTSNTGSIIGLSTEDVNIRTADLTLNASDSIYGAYHNPPTPGYLTTQVDDLTDIQAGTLIKIWDIGKVVGEAGQPVTLTNVSTASGPDFSVYVVTQYDMLVGSVSDNTDVSLTSLDGAILDNNGGDAPNIVTASGTLYLSAATGIGSEEDFLDIEADTLTAETTGTSANIYIKELNDLYVNTITAGPVGSRGNVALTAGGFIQNLSEAKTIHADILNITASTGIGTNDDYLNTDVNTLTAETTGTGADIYIDEANNLIINTVTAGPADARGDVKITASGSITDLPETTTIHADTLTLNADSIGTSGNPLNTDIDHLHAFASGPINIYDTGSLTLDNVQGGKVFTEDVNIEADGDINVGHVSDPLNVTLTSNHGSIIGLDKGTAEDGTPIPNIETHNLYLYANDFSNGKIYGEYPSETPGYLFTQIQDLTAYAGVLAKIRDVGTLIEGTGQQVTIHNVIIGGADLSVDIITKYDMLLAGSISDPTDVKLTSLNGAIIDGNDGDGTVTNITTNELTLNAVKGIGSSGNPVETKVNTLIALNTDSGNIAIVNSGDLYAQSVVNNGGDVDLTVNSSLTVGNILGQVVNLTANSGSILDDTDETNGITTVTVNLKAKNDIGANTPNGDIDIDASEINAQAGGDVYIESLVPTVFNTIVGNKINLLGDGTAFLINITGNSAVIIRATSGDIWFTGTVTSNTSGADISADTGSMYVLGAGPHLVTNADTFLSTPGGTITAIGSPLDVTVNSGFLVLNIGSKVGLESGRLVGTVPSYNNILFVPSSFPSPLYPSGLVYFNGVVVWPSTNTFASSQTNEALLGRYTVPVNFPSYLFSTVDPRLSFFYHPLTPSDMSAFDEAMDVGEDAYEFIGDSLNLIGHDGLLPILDDIKRKKLLPVAPLPPAL